MAKFRVCTCILLYTYASDRISLPVLFFDYCQMSIALRSYGWKEKIWREEKNTHTRATIKFCFKWKKIKQNHTHSNRRAKNSLHVQCMSLDWRYTLKYKCLCWFFFLKKRVCYKSVGLISIPIKLYIFKLNLMTETVLSIGDAINFNQFFFFHI